MSSTKGRKVREITVCTIRFETESPFPQVVLNTAIAAIADRIGYGKVRVTLSNAELRTETIDKEEEY